MDDQDSKDTTKRRFKDPETFREKVSKASTSVTKPKKVRTKITWPINFVKKIFSPLAKGYKRLKAIKQLKPLFALLAFIGRIILPKYIRNSFQELKKVTWPSFAQSRKLTYAVLAFAIIFGASVAAVDWGLGKIFRRLLLK